MPRQVRNDVWSFGAKFIPLLFAFGPIVRNGSADAAEHAGEDELMQGIQRVPIRQPKQADGIKDRSLPHDRGTVFFGNFKFQPSSARYFHFRLQPQQAILFKRFDSPEVQGIADPNLLIVSPAATNTHTPDQQVQE